MSPAPPPPRRSYRRAAVSRLALILLLLSASAWSRGTARAQETKPSPKGAAAADSAFYVPENPTYTIVQSAVDSVRFTVEKTLGRCDKGHIASISSFVDPEAKIMDWHDFGNLEGPGWAANAAGGAWELLRFGRFLEREQWTSAALGIVDHVLDHGFIDAETGIIRGYRNTKTNELVLNYKQRSDWLCPGSMAKVGFQLLLLADALPGDPRAARLREAAARCGRWLYDKLPETENGWFPRRVGPDGALYRKSPEGGNDAFWQTSADGLFILQLWGALTRSKVADYSFRIATRVSAFTRAGGIFGSINHDTYDPDENVAYSVAFRVFLDLSYLLQNPQLRAFAYSRCLGGLEQFQMREDRNGVATKGLLYMERTWPTAYLWENAEAALALFEAALDLRGSMPELARKHELTGLTILRAISKHHYGPNGFLTEGVDWSNHVGQRHHIGGKEHAAIQYTEPFLNNQHIVEPTLFYLERLATRETTATEEVFRDAEGSVLLRRSPPRAKAAPATESTREPEAKR